MEPGIKADIVAKLQADILHLHGLKSCGNAAVDAKLGSMRNAFPNASFPLGAVHEFISFKSEDTSSASGFISGLLASLLGNSGTLVWISACRNIFPPALRNFGIEPHHVVFVDLQKEKHVLWAMEEALKCDALSAVVGEMQEIDFTASRRLQLAVEQSKVTGFIIRRNPRKLNTTACVSRWKITTLPSEQIEDLPGIGYPKWYVELLRVRNGKPGYWHVEWINGKFHTQEVLEESIASPVWKKTKTG